MGQPGKRLTATESDLLPFAAVVSMSQDENRRTTSTPTNVNLIAAIENVVRPSAVMFARD